jgi:hypothetical protein
LFKDGNIDAPDSDSKDDYIDPPHTIYNDASIDANILFKRMPL